jgi:hypothetical protein
VNWLKRNNGYNGGIMSLLVVNKINGLAIILPIMGIIGGHYG